MIFPNTPFHTMRTFRLTRLALPLALTAALAAGCAGKQDNSDGDGEQQAVSSADKTVTDCSTLNTDANAPGEGADEGEDATDAQASPDPSDLPFHASGPVATVGDEEIGADKFNREVAKLGRRSRAIPPRLAKRFGERLLQTLIDRHIIEETIADSQIGLTRGEIEDEMTSFRERFPNKDAYQRFLKMRQTSEPELRSQICQDLQLRALLKENYGVGVSDQEARAYYDANTQQFEHAEQVHARHILIKVDRDASDDKVEEARKKAAELAEKARQDDADFAELAKQHSEGPSSRKGGDLGFFTAKRMVPPFSKAAFDLERGEVSDPVRTRFGFHVIKLVDRKDAHTESFEEARESIVQQLERKQTREAYDKMMKDLRAEVEIQKHPENIEYPEASGSPQGQPKGMPPELRKKLQEKIKQQKQQQQKEQGKDDPTDATDSAQDGESSGDQSNDQSEEQSE